MSKTSLWSTLSILGALVTCGAAGVISAACTVTSGPVTTTDSGTLDGNVADTGTSDTGTVDAGTDTGSTCSATNACPVVNTAISFDSCGNCDKCLATNCCDKLTACFTKAADGGLSDCENLSDCIIQSDRNDGGTAGQQACLSAYPTAVQQMYADVGTCLDAKCGPPNDAGGTGTGQCQ